MIPLNTPERESRKNPVNKLPAGAEESRWATQWKSDYLWEEPGHSAAGLPGAGNYCGPMGWEHGPRVLRQCRYFHEHLSGQCHLHGPEGITEWSSWMTSLWQTIRSFMLFPRWLCTLQPLSGATSVARVREGSWGMLLQKLYLWLSR